jgi:Abortive infection alpha
MSDVPADPGSDHASDGLAGADALPGLARLAATAWLHGAEWALGESLKVSLRLVDAATSPQSAARLIEDTRRTARSIVRDLYNAAKLDERVPGAASAADVARKVSDAVPFAPRTDDESENGGGREHGQSHNGVPRSLREEGEALLRLSRDVHYEFDAHPAYQRILSELAPDEGRILRLLLLEGPQPSIDVRTGGPVGMVRSRLVAPGLSMIGARAGCRYVERVPAYLNNLFRLGLIWFSRETLHDPTRYQVLEAQPDVLEAINSVPHAKVIRRSIHLTPFGEDFCRVCLTPESPPGELPQHSVPDEAITPQPPVAEP